jgi:hypothetical protein
VITNGTGLGQGHRVVPANQYFGSLLGGMNMGVSDNPLKK